MTEGRTRAKKIEVRVCRSKSNPRAIRLQVSGRFKAESLTVFIGLDRIDGDLPWKILPTLEGKPLPLRREVTSAALSALESEEDSQRAEGLI